jgi:hypothetical protein
MIAGWVTMAAGNPTGTIAWVRAAGTAQINFNGQGYTNIVVLPGAP